MREENPTELRPIGSLAFAARHLLLDGSRIQLDRYPHLVDPAASIDRGAGTIVIIRGPPQVFGKTLLGQCSMARDLVVNPARALWYCLTGEEAGVFSDAKWGPLMLGSGLVMSRSWDENDRRGGKKLFRFPLAPIEFLGAETLSSRNSRSAQSIYMDESWQYGAGHVREILARAESYTQDGLEKVVLMETAPTRGGETDALFETSTKKVWHPVCPSCRVNVDLGMGNADTEWGFKWDRDETCRTAAGRWIPTAARKTARYVCPHCKAATRYSRETLRWMNDPANGARYIQTNATPDPKIHGYHATSFCFSDWEVLVGKWLTANNAKRSGDMSLVEDFKRKDLCLPWDINEDIQTNSTVSKGAYLLGETWADEHKFPNGRPARFMAVDVQKDHFIGAIRAYDKEGRSRLIFRGKLLTQYEIEDTAKRFGVPYGHWFEERLPGRGRIIACESHVFLDAAYSPGSLVPRICATFGFHCVIGDKPKSFRHEDDQWRIYAPGRYVDPFIGTGKEAGRQVLLYRFSSNGVADRVEASAAARDAFDRPFMTVPSDVGEEWHQQFSAEQKVKAWNSDGTTWTLQWKRIRPMNHYFDCEKILAVAASMAGLVGGGAVEPEQEGENEKARG